MHKQLLNASLDVAESPHFTMMAQVSPVDRWPVNMHNTACCLTLNIIHVESLDKVDDPPDAGHKR